MATRFFRARRFCAAPLSACAAVAVAVVALTAGAVTAAPVPALTQVHALDGYRVTLDVYPAAGLQRGAAILSPGFTRSRRTLSGHAQALADAGGSHCDFESPTDWLCRLACGDTDPARQQLVRQRLLDAAARWLP